MLKVTKTLSLYAIHLHKSNKNVIFVLNLKAH
nr:MAG TPA: hypothetical protein [Bacteriophage sp.]